MLFRDDDGTVYYAVEYDKNGQPKILDLPQGDDASEYIIEVASADISEKLGCSRVAVKADAGAVRERDDWDDRGGQIKN